MVLTLTLAILALLSLILTLWQFAGAWRFPLHQRTPNPSFTPAVTVLKPLKGCDAETSACLESWLQQDYPGDVQLLLGAASETDPVCDLARTLIAAHPRSNAQLVICPARLGPNAKVSTLVQLEPLIQHEILVVSDADVRVPADLLTQTVAPLSGSGVGLVNCFYRLANPVTLAMRWEALAVNADFWSQVLQSRSLRPLNFALGAVMATSRACLARIGGFASLVDYLADDYQLGHRIAHQGGRIELCPVVVECWTAPLRAGEVWAHQLRWGRTIRTCQPVPYFFSVLSNGTLWPVLWWLSQPTWTVAAVAILCLGIRMAVAAYCAGKLTRRFDPRSPGLALVKDLLQCFVWVLAFSGNRVTWRGEGFHVRAGGRLVRAEPGPPS